MTTRYLFALILLTGLHVSYSQTECVSCGLTPPQARNWEGDVSSDWNDANNWENNVLPANPLDAVIDADDYVNPPIISVASTFTPDDVLIRDGGVLTVQADLTIEDDFAIESGGVLQIDGGTVATDDDFNLCAGGRILVTGGTLDNTPLGGSGILRVCVDTPTGQPTPSIDITGGSVVTTTTDTPDGFDIEDFLNISGDGSYSDGDGNTILPVVLFSFSGRAIVKGVQLRWETATEVNNDHFEIQRSIDGLNFETIGIVNGAGTINTPQSYEFLDSTPAATNYYRLRQVDFDGEFEIFPPLKVGFADFQTAYRATYSPTENRLLFSSSNNPKDVRLYDPSGRVVLQYTAIENFDASTAAFSPGIYLLRVVDKSLQSTERFVIGR